MREREGNVVIYGAQESRSQENREKIEDDRRFVKSLLEACDVEHNHERILVFRLGKTIRPNKPRPLLVKQRSSAMKQDLFRNIHKLQGKKI